MKVKSILLILSLLVIGGCLFQKDPFEQYVNESIRQCVTPIREYPQYVSLGGISATSDGSLFAVADGEVFLFNNKGELLWEQEYTASSYALLVSDGSALLAECYNDEESWKSTIVKLDSEGNILWERQTGLIGANGLAMASDGSFIAVGARDQEDRSHLMLFSGDGNKLWDHELPRRVEVVAVSKSGYVMGKPWDGNIYVYDRTGKLLFTLVGGNYFEEQDFAIAPDETYFLFPSENKYLNCYTFEGKLVWQREVEDVCTLRISTDGKYIAAGTDDGKLFLLDRDGNTLWSRQISNVLVDRIAITAHGEYVAVTTERGFFHIAGLEVYNTEGELLWEYEQKYAFHDMAMSDDGRYIAAGCTTVLFFDNAQAIKEYAVSGCAQAHSHILMH